MKEFFEKSAMQNHPLRVLQSFLDQEKGNEIAKKYDDLRFVGYVLDIGYDTVTIITSDPYKIAVGGVPRNSMLIMVPANYDKLPPHFTLLRVLEAAPTPLSKEVQQTYFELHDGAARRLRGAEELGVDRVHSREIRDVREVHGAADHVRQGGAAGRQVGADVLQHLARLGRNVAEVRLVGGRVHRNLAGYVNEPAGLDRRGVRAARAGNSGRRYALDHKA